MNPDAAAGAPAAGGAVPLPTPLSTPPSARLFFAVEPDDEARQALEDASASLLAAAGDRRGIRWVQPQNLHVTLKFLGECPIDAIPAIIEAAAGAFRTSTHSLCAIKGVGIFSSGRGQSVIYALMPDSAPLGRLAGKLDAALESEGYSRERRAFRAHVTLARVTTPEAARSIKPLLARIHLETVFPVHSVVLFQSTLTRGAPVYMPLARFPLL